MELKKAYFQIQVLPSCGNIELCTRGNIFLLTRLAFGLTSAPVVMTKIVERILSQDEILNKAVSSYIDDVFVDEGLLNVEKAKQYFRFVGTRSKRTRKITLSYRYLDS